MEDLKKDRSTRQVAVAIGEFNDRARKSPDENSVLDASEGAEVRRANIYRDYISKRVVKTWLQPKSFEVILDFGCGIGRMSRYLSPFADRIEGIDRAEEMIKAAGASLPSNVGITHIDSHLLPYDSGRFDKAFTFWVLQHINDEELSKILSEIHRVLKIGGVIVLLEQTRETARWFGSVCIQRTIEDYERLLNKAGFRKRKTRQVIRFPSYSMSIWNRLGSSPRIILPALEWIERMTVNRRPQFREYSTTAFLFEK
jgi:ubiquinone/menaquinone biosynthesis C-methylase UbiE